ncbi:MAG: hypothetical protein Q8Q09_08480 [Deltaproteobacteria bacterium]|nr:hypothetical protein [Deltaproteobacteria bacterium]
MPSTLTFVIDAIDPGLTPPDAQFAIPGFNLDGVFTDADGATPRSCSIPDTISSLDPTQNCPVDALDGEARCRTTAGCARGPMCRGGVDNALPVLIDAFENITSTRLPHGIRPLITQQVRRSRIVYVLRFTGIDSLTSDDSVTLNVYRGFATFRDRCESVLPGREYAIDSASVVDRDLERPTLTPIRGAIRGGRFVTTTPGTGFSPVIAFDDGTLVEVEATRVQFAANLRTDGLGQGNFGGLLRGPALASILAPLFGTAIVNTIVGGTVDVEEPVPTPGSVVGACRSYAPLAPLGNLSVGWAFTAVPIVLASEPLASRPVGACGQ